MLDSINILTTPPTKVVFISKAVKEAYIIKEARATSSERTKRYTCDLAEVNNAIAALADAQRHFAVSQGYVPTKGDTNVLAKPTYTEGNLV